MCNTLPLNHHFWGRKDEIRELQEVNWRKRAQLIVVYGRRRVGKTSLVEHAYQDQVIWKFEGLESESPKKQLQGFLGDLAIYAGKPELKNYQNLTWKEALTLLAKEIKNKKLILFIDEFQWLANMKPSFVSLFKSIWDNQLRKNPHLRCVLCGSISSFMVKKVISSKALYGRVDTEINLQPLKNHEIDTFFSGTRSKNEILQINMIFGGIPLYLEELNVKFSLIQNLNEYAFKQHGFFFQEYRRLFINHFADTPIYEKILSNLVEKPMAPEELANVCQTTTGGRFTDRLLDLELAGFIKRYSPLNKGHKSKIIHYRLYDEYLHFYYRFILPNIQEILNGQIASHDISSSQEFKQWQGYAFERLCLKHVHYIARALQFSGIRYKSGPWFQRRSKNVPGAQIDILFERADHIITICECKYTSKINEKSLIDSFENKLEALSQSYSSYGKQTVLILGKKCPIPSSIERYFNEILFAEDIFWLT
jgi:AAA+ ATPase superfamily predicted ATPase